jgi:methylase of polypeptide subunit release factors
VGAEALVALSNTLAFAGYTEPAIDRLVRDGGILAFDEGLAALRLRPDADERLTALVRLFFACEPIELDLAAAALEPVSPTELGELLTIRDGTARSHVCLQPYEGLLVAVDPADRLRADQVLGVGPATRTLAQLTVRRPVEAALDLGSGSGVQALLAARHSERVVGVDINPRALRLARLSAALNGTENVEWRQGDLYEPVGEEHFDLVVANPPFILSPAREFLFRDGGLEGDELSRSVVTGAAARLREGGFAHVLCSWVSEPSRPWSQTPRHWLRDSGCDAWLLHDGNNTPTTYAMRWNRRSGRAPAATAAAAEQWLDYYRTRGIEAISSGSLVLRRRSGRNWVREDELGPRPMGQGGAHVERVFAAQDFLEGLATDRDLLDAVLERAPETWLIERRDAAGTLERARLAVAEGVPVTGRIPPACLPVVGALDGRRTLREILDGGGRASVDEALPVVRELVALGLVTPTARWPSGLQVRTTPGPLPVV